MPFGSSHTAVRCPVNNNLFFIKSVSGISCQVQYCSSLTAVNEGASSYNIITDVLFGHFFTEALRNQSTVSDDKFY